jgi:hypothetical protein
MVGNFEIPSCHPDLRVGAGLTNDTYSVSQYNDIKLPVDVERKTLRIDAKGCERLCKAFVVILRSSRVRTDHYNVGAVTRTWRSTSPSSIGTMQRDWPIKNVEYLGCVPSRRN